MTAKSEGPDWIRDPDYLLLAFVIAMLWSTGGGMVIYLSGLADIPQDTYVAWTSSSLYVWTRSCSLSQVFSFWGPVHGLAFMPWIATMG